MQHLHQIGFSFDYLLGKAGNIIIIAYVQNMHFMHDPYLIVPFLIL